MFGRRRRKRRGYIRPSRAKPKTGWSLRGLSTLTGIVPRTLRLYLQRGALPRAVFQGSATRYTREHLLKLLAIRKLRATERLDLTAIAVRLKAMPDSELEAFATSGLSPGPLAEALGLSVVAAPATSASAPGTASGGRAMASAGEPWPAGAPQWVRTELALGLELHVRTDAGEGVRDLVRRIRELCASGERTAG